MGLEPVVPDLGGDSDLQSFNWNHSLDVRTRWSSDWKRGTTWELWAKLDLGQNEDCSLGHSTSNNSEELLQRGRGRGSIYKLFGVQCKKKNLLIYKRFSASHKELMSPWRDLVPFYRRRDARIGILKSVTEFRACLKTNLSKDLFNQFPLSTECLTLHPQGVLKVGSCSQVQLNRIQSTQRQMANALVVFSHWQIFLASANL